VLLRCEAIKAELGHQFMNAAKASLTQLSSVCEHYGPLPAPMEKRAGRFRSQIFLQSNNRKDIHQTLQQWLPQLRQLKEARKIRWSIDVDPYDTY
jgi:primosomal protein N' (replication factor Y)